MQPSNHVFERDIAKAFDAVLSRAGEDQDKTDEIGKEEKQEEVKLRQAKLNWRQQAALRRRILKVKPAKQAVAPSSSSPTPSATTTPPTTSLLVTVGGCAFIFIGWFWIVNAKDEHAQSKFNFVNACVLLLVLLSQLMDRGLSGGGAALIFLCIALVLIVLMNGKHSIPDTSALSGVVFSLFCCLCLGTEVYFYFADPRWWARYARLGLLSVSAYTLLHHVITVCNKRRWPERGWVSMSRVVREFVLSVVGMCLCGLHPAALCVCLFAFFHSVYRMVQVSRWVLCQYHALIKLREAEWDKRRKELDEQKKHAAVDSEQVAAWYAEETWLEDEKAAMLRDAVEDKIWIAFWERRCWWDWLIPHKRVHRPAASAERAKKGSKKD